MSLWSWMGREALAGAVAWDTDRAVLDAAGRRLGRGVTARALEGRLTADRGVDGLAVYLLDGEPVLWVGPVRMESEGLMVRVSREVREYPAPRGVVAVSAGGPVGGGREGVG